MGHLHNRHSHETQHKLGTSSVLSMYNEHDFLVGNIPMGDKLGSRLCLGYTTIKHSVFRDRPFKITVVLSDINPSADDLLDMFQKCFAPTEIRVIKYRGWWMSPTDKAHEGRYVLSWKPGEGCRESTSPEMGQVKC
ncbi:hypothetical protein N7535_003072 [Penicillium sp. DV-2018c]|nr:hypothetical protein N7461_001236 [Penicillium sp. DV-2018c]KAJ5576146.1 hypothetical protein N7535_003072 [Penicillium sp. DV-2018c]